MVVALDRLGAWWDVAQQGTIIIIIILIIREPSLTRSMREADHAPAVCPVRQLRLETCTEITPVPIRVLATVLSIPDFAILSLFEQQSDELDLRKYVNLAASRLTHDEMQCMHVNCEQILERRCHCIHFYCLRCSAIEVN